ncbi:MAG: aldehyde dehydrogenase [Prolixibacteraceae bacterium]
MHESSTSMIEAIIREQRIFFRNNVTNDLNFRIENLKKFRAAIILNEEKITEALWLDLHKSKEEAYLTEVSIVLKEIDTHLKNIRKWAAPKRVKTPLHLLPSNSQIQVKPLGNVLIIAPWNYPLQMLFLPLVGAISSGCCALLKPSPYTPNTAKVMEDLINEIFDPGYIAVVQGGREVNQFLLEQRFDLIFFTGSPALGKIVMKAASRYLTPVVLELGGKSPCIVDEGANIEVAAKRIAWGKCINAGQTCIAPDYLFVHYSLKDQLIKKIGQAITEMYGNDLKESRFYPRIVNDHAVERLQGLMKMGRISFGGDVDVSRKFIAPTIIEDVQPEFPVMQEEIFGPILPVMTYDDLNKVITYINENEKPLALYYFGPADKASRILSETTSGGGCINDTLLHIANPYLPFGGVGNSGMNNYHGHHGFLAFSHRRSILTSRTWIDLSFKYAPFRHFKWLRKII